MSLTIIEEFYYKLLTTAVLRRESAQLQSSHIRTETVPSICDTKGSTPSFNGNLLASFICKPVYDAQVKPLRTLLREFGEQFQNVRSKRQFGVSDEENRARQMCKVC